MLETPIIVSLIVCDGKTQFHSLTAEKFARYSDGLLDYEEDIEEDLLLSPEQDTKLNEKNPIPLIKKPEFKTQKLDYIQ